MAEIDVEKRMLEGLWRIYRREERPSPWEGGGNLPWNDPAFSARMLREHLDENHGAASRRTAEREAQIAWLWNELGLQPGHRLLDVTCGPGLYAVPLAERGVTVTGVDFGPAAIAHARQTAAAAGVSERCAFIEEDVRRFAYPEAAYDAALFIYGQLAVFPREEAASLLDRIARSLRPGGKLCVELLNQEQVDKKDSSWWYTDNTGIWGDAPFLHLGQRFWDAEQQLSTERFQILHLETGRLDEIVLSDQTYAVAEMTEMMHQAGFASVSVYPAWDGLPLSDAKEWLVYVAMR
jgi:ubiquinone/menaquinone biosynthesis C-methylase UbiE